MVSEQSARHLDTAPVILAGVTVSAIGALFYNTLPIYLGAAQDYRELANDQIGFIGTLFFLGYTLASGSGFFWIRRVDWRLTSYGSVALASLGLLLAAGGSSYGSLLAGVFVAGCGFAAIYSVGTTLLSDTANPARWYGAKITAEAALGVVLLILVPAFALPRWGFMGVGVALITAAIVLAPVILLLPAEGVRTDPGPASELGGTQQSPVWFALIGCSLFMCGQTAIWGFVERIGANIGFDPTLVGTLLAVSLIFALAGSLLAAWLGNRIGCLKPLIWSHLIFFLGLASLTRADLFEAYALGACLVMFSVGLGIAFSVSSVAELDPDGRFVVLSVPAIGIGVMIGPGAAGWLAKEGAFGPVLALGFVTLLISFLAFVFANRQNRRAPQLMTQRDGP